MLPNIKDTRERERGKRKLGEGEREGDIEGERRMYRGREREI